MTPIPSPAQSSLYGSEFGEIGTKYNVRQKKIKEKWRGSSSILSVKGVKFFVLLEKEKLLLIPGSDMNVSIPNLRLRKFFPHFGKKQE